MRVEEHADHRIIVVRRKAEDPSQLASSAEVVAGYEEISRLVRSKYQGWGLVVDLRQARGRNDDDFERAAMSLVRQLMQAFTRIVLLVGTAAGQLQVQRMQTGGLLWARDDEAAAFRLAAGQ